MLALELEDFTIELKDGAIKNVGPATKRGSAKLFDVEDVELRAFGDKRVKLVARDDDGNELQVAMFPEHVEILEADLDALRAESPVFE